MSGAKPTAVHNRGDVTVPDAAADSRGRVLFDRWTRAEQRHVLNTASANGIRTTSYFLVDIDRLARFSGRSVRESCDFAVETIVKYKGHLESPYLFWESEEPVAQLPTLLESEQ